MKLLHRDFKFVFEFEENSRNLLVVEHPEIFRRMIEEFLQDEVIEEQRFVLSESEATVKMKDQLLCIVDPLSLSLNERKLLGKLGEVLKKEILCSELLLENNRIIAALERYALRIIQEADWELFYTSRIDVQSLLKFLGIQFEDQQNTLIEKVMNYMKVTHDLLGVKGFVFVHLLSYLTEYEVEKFCEYICYYKLHVLFLESRQPEKIERFTKLAIIDKDACEILLDM